MTTRRRLAGAYGRLFAASLVLMATLAPVLVANGAQKDAASDRGVMFERFRPAAKGRAGRKRPKYRLNGPKLDSGPIAPDAAIGVTIFRLRRSTPADPTATREIVQDREETGEWTPERVASDMELSVGQRFRLAVETPRKGYLYVVNRSRYADGTGDPWLIFPTGRIRGGDNRVHAGRLVEIPAQYEKPFRIVETPGRELIDEELLVVVAPQPLDVVVDYDRKKLDPALVAKWERQWSAPSESYDVIGGQGMIYSIAEKSAGGATGRLLAPGDPPPQTVYYIAAKPGDPLLLRVPIGVRRDAPPRAN